MERVVRTSSHASWKLAALASPACVPRRRIDEGMQAASYSLSPSSIRPLNIGNCANRLNLAKDNMIPKPARPHYLYWLPQLLGRQRTPVVSRLDRNRPMEDTNIFERVSDHRKGLAASLLSDQLVRFRSNRHRYLE